MRARIDRILAWIGGLTLAGLFLGYLGEVHPAGDSLAVFRDYLAVLLAVSGFARLALGTPKALWSGLLGVAVFASLGILPVGPGRQVAPEGAEAQVYRHYQKNVWLLNQGTGDLVADILAEAPDTVTLQEAAGAGAAVAEALRGAYPAQVACGGGEAYGLAVFARWQPVEGTAFCHPRVAGVQVEGPAGRLWVVAVHLRWPYPFPNADQSAALARDLAALDGPMIVGGDFNMVPWAASFRRVAAEAGLTRIGRAPVTFVGVGGLLRVQIDHVLATGGQGRTEPRPFLGSDHRGLRADFVMHP